MIDIHTHILPEIDDGASSLEQSLEMADMAVEDGITTLIATPHCLNGLYSISREKIISACKKLNSALEGRNIPLTILPGSEIRLCPEIMGELEQGRLMTVNDAGKYIFLELPDQFIPRSVMGFLNRLRDRGIIPVITHPERNPVIQQHVEVLNDLISAGGLSQITAGSLTGDLGRRAFKSCRQIVEQNLVHFVASDAHSVKSRPPVLSAAFKKLSTLAGEDAAEEIMIKAPLGMLESA